MPLLIPSRNVFISIEILGERQKLQSTLIAFRGLARPTNHKQDITMATSSSILVSKESGDYGAYNCLTLMQMLDNMSL